MDKNNNNKTVSFLKKEGFYIILFVCLCAVATVAAITSRNNKKVASNPPAVNEQAKVQNQGPIIAEEPSKEFNDALQVKKEGLKPVPKLTVEKVNNDDLKVAPVSKPVKAQLSKPINEGTLARAYSEDVQYWESTKSDRPNWGIDIKAEIGTPVLASMDGKVVKVDFTNEGDYVLIDHKNGIFTKYCNLDKDIMVKEGDAVKAKQQIGKVGNTTLNASHEEYGSHLHYEVLKKDNSEKTGYKYEDPSKYVKYELKQDDKKNN